MFDVTNLRKAGKCVYIAMEMPEAAEVSNLMGDAANEIERLRVALKKIAVDTYDKADERVRWEQPTMIWQSVAKLALGQKPAKL